MTANKLLVSLLSKQRLQFLFNWSIWFLKESFAQSVFVFKIIFFKKKLNFANKLLISWRFIFMVKFILGKLFTFFQLSVHTRSGMQRESDTKGWEKRLCVPVRRGKRVCVGAKQTVLGKRRDRTSSLNTSKLRVYFRKNSKKSWT